MSVLDSLAKDLNLIVRRIRSSVGTVPGPQAVLSELQGIDFQIGERVYDTVNGEEVQVLGTGITNIPSESSGA